MNERIQKLAEQAGLGHERWNTTVQFEQFMQKFAELIVRECAEFCENKNSKLLGTMMKEHFGVAE